MATAKQVKDELRVMKVKSVEYWFQLARNLNPVIRRTENPDEMSVWFADVNEYQEAGETVIYDIDTLWQIVKSIQKKQLPAYYAINEARVKR